MILPEVVGGLLPKASILQGIALRRVGAVVIEHKPLIEAIVASQPYFVKVLVGSDTCLVTIGAVHDALVV